jgi:hypothetical protein
MHGIEKIAIKNSAVKWWALWTFSLFLFIFITIYIYVCHFIAYKAESKLPYFIFDTMKANNQKFIHVFP